MRANPRVTKVTLAVYNTACPRCLELQGTYAKDAAPPLPVRGCSCPNGCTCMYLPVLAEIFP